VKTELLQVCGCPWRGDLSSGGPPHHRIILHVSPVAYRGDLPERDGVGHSSFMTRTIFSRRKQATPRQTRTG